MVVGITLTTIALVRSRRGIGVSFVDAESFRDAIKKRIEDKPRRARVLAIVDAMIELASGFDDELRRALGDYLETTRDYEAQPAQIIETTLGPLEDERHSTLLSYIELREQLRDELLALEWDKVFGKPETE